MCDHLSCSDRKLIHPKSSLLFNLTGIMIISVGMVGKREVIYIRPKLICWYLNPRTTHELGEHGQVT